MDLTVVCTPRLILTRPQPADLQDLHAMWSDPKVWEHFPSQRHTRSAASESALAKGIQAWQDDGLGWWVARTTEPAGHDGAGAGSLVGMGGCTVRAGLVWNLGYRLVRSTWGHGYVQEIITAARSAAATTRPDLAITAYLLEHNEGSQHSIERAGGFTPTWRGPDAGNPDPGAVRLLYTDRPLDAATAETLAAYP